MAQVANVLTQVWNFGQTALSLVRLSDLAEFGKNWANLGIFGKIWVHLCQFWNIWPSLGTFGSIWECMCWGRRSWRRKAAPLLPRSCIALHHPPLNPLHHPPPFYKLHREIFTLPYSITDCSRPLQAGGDDPSPPVTAA